VLRPVRRDGALVWFAFGCIALAGLVFWAWEGRGNTFFFDEWSWIEFRHSGLAAILDSYNAHLLVVPLAVYQALFHTIGIAHYRWYRLLALGAHLACATMVFTYARRRLGAAALLLALPVVFLGSGWEYVLWGVNFGFVLSLALGIGALLALERDDSRGDEICCGLLVAALACSEYALLFAIGIAVELLWRRQLRKSWVWLVPLALYGAWWVAYYRPYLSSYDIGLVPKFVANMASGAAGAIFGLGIQKGRLVLIGLVLVLAVRVWRRHELGARLANLIVIALAFWLLVAYGRAQLGDPGASRYGYVGVVLLALILAEAFRDVRAHPAVLGLMVVLAGLAVFGNLRAIGPGERSLSQGSNTEAAELGALQLAHRTAPRTLALDPHYSPQIIPGPYFAAVRDLHSTPAITTKDLAGLPEPERTAVDYVLVRMGELSITTSAHPPVVRTVPRVVDTTSSSVTRASYCLRLTPSGSRGAAEVPVPASGLAFRAGDRSDAPAGFVQMRRFAAGFENSPVAAIPGSAAVIVRPAADQASRPWIAEITATRRVLICTLSS
jgi:hypothetical protein